MNEIISQTDLVKLTGKSKQQISQLANKRNPPFDTQLIGNRIFILLSDRTKFWIVNNKK